MKVVHTHEGDREELTVEEAIEDRVLSASALSLMASTQAKIEDGSLTDEVRHNEGVTERALEEDVMQARVAIPGWFINNDDELQDHYGRQHDGAMVSVDALVEDYSDSAWRIVAEEIDSAAGDLVHQYAWNFVPKSVVTVTHVEGIESQDDADDLSRRARSKQRQRNTGWLWERGDDEMPPLEDDRWEDTPDEEPEVEPGTRVKAGRAGMTSEGEVLAITPRHGGDGWQYHVHTDAHEPGETEIEFHVSPVEDEDDDEPLADGFLGVLESAEREYEGDAAEAISATMEFAHKSYVNGWKVSTRPSKNDDGELKGVEPVENPGSAASNPA